MKARLLTTAAMVIGFGTPQAQAAVAVMSQAVLPIGGAGDLGDAVPFPSAVLADAIDEYRLSQHLDHALNFEGLRVLETDGINDLTLGGKFLRLQNSVFETLNTLSIVTIGCDERGNSIVLDGVSSCKSKSLHLVSNHPNAVIHLNGVLQTVEGDLVIEALGDVLLPALSVQGNMSITTTGRIMFQEPALISGSCSLTAKSIEVKQPVSLQGEGCWIVNEGIQLNSDVTSEVGLCLNAGTTVTVDGRLGAENIVVESPKFTLSSSGQLVVRNTAALDAAEMHLDGQWNLKSGIFHALELHLNGHGEMDSFDVKYTPSIHIDEGAIVAVSQWVDREVVPEIPPASSAVRPPFTLYNGGQLTIRRSMELVRNLRQSPTGAFIALGALDVGGDIVNDGRIDCARTVCLMALPINLVNRGIIRSTSIISTPTQGVNSIQNPGVITLNGASKLSARDIVLSGKIRAFDHLDLCPAAHCTQMDSGTVHVGKTLKLHGVSANMGGMILVGEDFDIQLNRSISFSDRSGAVNVGRDFIFSGESNIFTAFNQSTPITIGRNLKIEVPSCHILSSIDSMGSSSSGVFTLAQIEAANLVQRGKLTIAGNVKLNVKGMADIEGGISSGAILSAKVDGTLSGDVRIGAVLSNLYAETSTAAIDVRAGASIASFGRLGGTLDIKAVRSELTATHADAKIMVEADTSTAVFGSLAARDDAYAVKNGTLHSMTVKSDTGGGISYSGGGKLAVTVDGTYTGKLDVTTSGEFEISHAGKSALTGTVIADKATVRAKSYPIHDFSNIDARHVHIDVSSDDIELVKDVNVAANRLFELTANNLKNHANIRGNFVAHIKKDLVNKGLIKGSAVILKIGGTFFASRGSTVHGERKEIIEADYFDISRKFIQEKITETKLKFGPFFPSLSTKVTFRDTGAYEAYTVSDRHDVSWTARKGDLDLRNMHFNVTGDVSLKSEAGSIVADAQKYYTKATSSDSDKRPHFVNTQIAAGGAVHIAAGKSITADGIDVAAKGTLTFDASDNIRLHTLAESYVARRWSRSGFLWFNSSSGVDYGLEYIEPTLKAGGDILLKGGKLDSKGAIIESRTGDSILSFKDTVHLGAKLAELPFERSKSSWWGLSSTSVKGREFISMVFSGTAQEKFRIVSEHGAITGEAPFIFGKKGVELVGAKGTDFKSATSGVIIDEEKQFGLQLRLFGIDFSLATERFKESELTLPSKGIGANPTFRTTDAGWRTSMLDESGPQLNSLVTLTSDPLCFGLGFRKGTYVSETKQHHGAVILTDETLTLGTKGDAGISLALHQVSAGKTEVDTKRIHIEGESTQLHATDIAMAGTLNVRTLGPIVPVLSGGIHGEVKAAVRTALQHRAADISLGDVHFARDHSAVSAKDVHLKIGETSGGRVGIATGHAIDTTSDLRAMGTGVLDVGLFPFKVLGLSNRLYAEATVTGRQEEAVKTTVSVKAPHDTLTLHESAPLETVTASTTASIDTTLLEVGSVLLLRKFGLFRNQGLLGLLLQYSLLTDLQKKVLKGASDPVSIFIQRYVNPLTKIDIPWHVKIKLAEAIQFANATESLDPKEKPRIPGVEYGTLTSKLSEAGDFESLIHRNSKFQYQTALFAGMAYNDDLKDGFQHKLKESDTDAAGGRAATAAALDRASVRWEIDASPSGFRDISGYLTATYHSEFGPVKVVSFMGTNHWSEWGGYTLTTANQFIPASTLDSRIPGNINANFHENYVASGWKVPVDPSMHYLFSGHSRGGAIADLAALHTGIGFGNFANIGSLTFAQPAVFSETLATQMNTWMGARSLKIVLEGDYIPHILGWGKNPVVGTSVTTLERFSSMGYVHQYPMEKLFNHGMNDYLEAFNKKHKF